MQYARERGVSTFKGSRVGVAQFVAWAAEHLGISDKDVQAVLAQLLKRELVTYSARGKDEILVEPKEGVILPDT